MTPTIAAAASPVFAKLSNGSGIGITRQAQTTVTEIPTISEISNDAAAPIEENRLIKNTLKTTVTAIRMPVMMAIGRVSRAISKT